MDAFQLGLGYMTVPPATQEAEAGRSWHLDQSGTPTKSLSQNERLKSGLGSGLASNVLMAQHEDRSPVANTYVKIMLGQL